LLALLLVVGSARAEKHAKADKHDVPAPHAAAPQLQPEAEKADDEEAHEAPDPKKMSVVVFLDRLSKFDIGPGTYQGEFYLIFHCDKEPCKPSPTPSNGKFTSKEEEKSDDPTVKIFKVKAELDAVVDLAEFPFDKHVLPLSLEDKDDDVQYEFDPNLNEVYKQALGLSSTVNPEVKLAGWNVDQNLTAAVKKKKIGAFEDNQLVFEIQIARPRLASMFKTLVPVFFMIFVAGFTLLLRPKSAAGRLSAATGGLMTVVMFHLSATSSLPPLGYLTRMDKFMLATYLVYLVNIAFAVAMVRFDEKKREKATELVYLVAGGVVPGIALVAWLTVFLKVA
jgi:hypothetical protein